MRKLIKYSLAFLTLLFVALFSIPFFMDVDDYRQDIVQLVEDKTGRTVEIQHMKISLFPWIGVQLEQVNMGNAQGFAQKDFISAQYVDVQLALLPLLSGEIRIKRFVLDTPKILLQRHADGTSNWQDLQQISTATANDKAMHVEADKAEPSTLFGAGLSAENVHIQNGDVIWEDAGKALHISQVNLEINGIYFDKPIPVNFSGKIADSPFQLRAKVGPIGDLATFDVDALPLQAELTLDALKLKKLAVILPMLAQFEDERLSLNIKIEQQPDGMKRTLGYISLQAKQQWKAEWTLDMPSMALLKIHEIKLQIDQQQVALLSGEVKDLLKDLRYEVRLKVGRLTREQLSRWLPALGEMYQHHPKPWQQLELAMLLSGGLKNAELRDMQLILDQELLQLSGQASFKKSIPDIRLRIAADQLHLDPWLPVAAKDTEVKNKAAVATLEQKETVASEPDLRFLSLFNVHTALQLGQLNAKGLDITNVQLTAVLKKGYLKVQPFGFDVSGGHVQQSFQLNANAFPVTWSKTLQLKQVQIKPMLMLAADSSMLSGLMQLESSINATGLTPKNMLPSLNGQGHFVLRDGEIEGFDIGAILKSLSPTAGSKKTYFSQLSGSYKIRKGVMSNNDLFMASPLFRLSAHGTVNLVKSSMDYYAKPKLVASTTGQGAVQGGNKGLVIPLRIHGPLSDPKVSLNVKLQDIFSAPNALKNFKPPAVQKMIAPKVGKQAEDIRESIKSLIPNF